jgi:hypothetical protein
MFEASRIRNTTACALAAMLICVAGPSLLAQPTPSTEQEAKSLLRKSMDYVAGLQSFSLQGQSTLEVVLTSGQKLQFDNDVDLVVSRPDKLRASRKGELVDQTFFYDGANVVLSNPGDRFYASVAAPKSLEAMLDFIRDEFDLLAPGADLIYANAYDHLTEDLTGGMVVSTNVLLRGTPCTHLAFRKPGVDFQIWVANGDKPVPMKYVLTTTDQPANPQFILAVVDWDTNPKIDASTFRFVPAEDAMKIDFIHAGAPAAAGK